MRHIVVVLLSCSLLLFAASAHAWSVPDTGDPNERTCNPQTYTDLGNGIVLDHVTGLMWQQATAPGTYTCDAAITYCENLYCAKSKMKPADNLKSD